MIFFSFIQWSRLIRITPEIFEGIKKKQKLIVQFEGFIGLLIKLFTTIEKEPQIHSATLIIENEICSKLLFEQNMQHKVIELLYLDVGSIKEDEVKTLVGYRYDLLKMKYQILESEFNRFMKIVKVKNPSLINQFQKAVKKDK